METIKIYDTKEFKNKFIEFEQETKIPFQSELFFCLKIEEAGHVKYPIPPSKHTCHTILFITSGVHNIKVGFEEYSTKTNEIIIIPAGQIFSISSNSKQLKGIICQFHQDFLIGKYGNQEIINDFDFLKIWGNPYICLPEREAGFVLYLLNRLQVEYIENGYTNLDIIKPYMITLLCEINKHTIKTNHKLTSAEVLTSKFKELIYNQSNKNCQVSHYSSILNVTPNHLNKSIKSVTGKSATKWIDETVLLEAKYLLYQTSFTISKIATQVGHNDQSYFSRIFKKHEGITPVQFRKLIDKS